MIRRLLVPVSRAAELFPELGELVAEGMEVFVQVFIVVEVDADKAAETKERLGEFEKSSLHLPLEVVARRERHRAESERWERRRRALRAKP